MMVLLRRLIRTLKNNEIRELTTSGISLAKGPFHSNQYLYPTHIEYIAALNVITDEPRRRKAGIICTIGPASRDISILVEMIEKGMSIARLNFSHGTHEYHLESISNIRKATEIFAEKVKRNVVVGIALDTKGAEIRTGDIEKGVNEEVHLEKGKEVRITPDHKFEKMVSQSVIYVNYKNIAKALVPKSKVYIDDGLIGLQVLQVQGNDVICKVTRSGNLGSKKGVNLPGTHVDLPLVTDQDRKDIEFAVKNKLDMIFASFVRNKECVQEIRNTILQHDPRKDELQMPIISKIENLQGVENLDEIIEASDGLMVARGDLGIEMPGEKVFLAQKKIIAKCNLEGKPIICATQMLESMIKKPTPTRAETSDVANAILDGADCVMLSGETAKGLYPVQCVKQMSKICLQAEAVIPYRQHFLDLQKMIHPPTSVLMSTAIAGVAAAEKSGASAICTTTDTGATAFILSKFRPHCPIFAVTTTPQIARKCNLYRGVTPVLYNEIASEHWTTSLENKIRAGLRTGHQTNTIKEGEIVILLTGWKKGKGRTNTVRIIKVTKEMLQ